MLTQRDRRILRFIEDMGIANTSQIYRVFFAEKTSKERCQQRLKELCRQGHLQRDRLNVSSDYLYFLKKPREIEHHLARTEFFVKANESFVLNDFCPEYAVESLRADAYMELENNGRIFGAFLEVQLSNGFDQGKYEKLYQAGAWRCNWMSFPLIIIATNHRLTIRPTYLRYVLIDTSTMDLTPLQEAIGGGVRQCMTM